jgi:hypothetical protein
MGVNSSEAIYTFQDILPSFLELASDVFWIQDIQTGNRTWFGQPERLQKYSLSNGNGQNEEWLKKIHHDEWRSYLLKAGNMINVEAEICGFRTTNLEYAISPIVVHIRRSREHLEKNSSPAVDDLTYWLAHNLRAPLATLEGLINLAKIQNNTAEMKMYLTYMSQNAESLDHKIRMMVRLASRSI